MDKNLLANTTYKYAVKAVDVVGNESVQSDTFTITTKTESASYEAWDAKKAYKKGIEFYTREKCMKQSRIMKDMGIQTGFLLYPYGKQCKLYLKMK